MKFSIITCTYNSEKYLWDNINSVESQTHKDFEHIFIDGFSTDNTIEIIKKYQKKYPDKVKLFQFEPKGISHAMNEGIDKSAGTYLIHLHSDDSFYSADTLQIVNNFTIKNDEPDWVYGKAKIVNVESNTSLIEPHRKIHHKIRFWLLLVMNYITHQSVFLKKEVFDKYGKFDETLQSNMDYDLWLRLSKNKVNSKFINSIICNFSVRDDSQTTLTRSDNEHHILYKKYVKSNVVVKGLLLMDKMHQKVIDKKCNVYKV